MNPLQFWLEKNHLSLTLSSQQEQVSVCVHDAQGKVPELISTATHTRQPLSFAAPKEMGMGYEIFAHVDGLLKTGVVEFNGELLPYNSAPQLPSVNRRAALELLYAEPTVAELCRGLPFTAQTLEQTMLNAAISHNSPEAFKGVCRYAFAEAQAWLPSQVRRWALQVLTEPDCLPLQHMQPLLQPMKPEERREIIKAVTDTLGHAVIHRNSGEWQSLTPIKLPSRIQRVLTFLEENSVWPKDFLTAHIARTVTYNKGLLTAATAKELNLVPPAIGEFAQAWEKRLQRQPEI